MSATESFERLATEAAALGLACRGGFHPTAQDQVPPLAGVAAGTLVLFGSVGSLQWPFFAAAPEFGDGQADPLDRWSRRLLDELARRHDGKPLYPFEGPPWLPFQRWAQRAEPVHPSPLGILIHPRYGLWHAYRGALVLRARLALPPPARHPHPCESCADQPCLRGCPVDALRAGQTDAAACRDPLRAPRGAPCRLQGCAARRRCPLGAAYAPVAAQAAFHMQAFLAGH